MGLSKTLIELLLLPKNYVNKSAVYGLLIALLLPFAGYFIIKTVSADAVVMPRHYIYDSVITRTEKGKEITDTLWHKLPDFSLTNQLGKRVGWDDVKGKVIVADFFFTRCPTICPKMTMNMKQLQDGITNAQKVGDRQAQFIQFISFSVDPQRDSVPELKKWADRFQINPENWWLLTGSKKEIYDLSIEHIKLGLVDGENIDTSFFHTDYMVLIDRNRNIRGYYHGLDSSEIAQLSRDIVLLSLEKDPRRKKFYEGKLGLIAIAFVVIAIGLVLFLWYVKKESRRYEPRYNKK
ncbi:MAG: SCO family protein [Chitinophagaceae bacterium]